jgi:NAD(P)-dependent dehydrogenase (short-subunit alcohol dehydrogenase family)
VDLGLRDKVVLVTGGSRGIGLAMAKAFAEQGAKVMLTARNEASLVAAVRSVPGEADYLTGNAGDPDHPAAAVAATVGRFGGVDVLINNAATNPYFGRMIDVDHIRFRKTFEVNLVGPLGFAQAAWRQRMQEHGGSIINIVSIGGFGHSGPVPVYDLTKSSLIHLTRRLANELGPNVRVNAIAPGLVKTEFARALWEEGGEDDWPWALRRLGMPEDVTGASLFLASDLAAWMTGAILVVDGGAVVGGTMI